MLARAERFPEHRGTMGAAVFEGDEILVDEGAGVVQHKYDPTKRSGKLLGAWARVRREGKDPTVRWLDLASRVQPTPLWGKDASGMILKCARVAVLRAAYPEAFGGLYVAGERPDDVDTGEEADVPAPITREKPALPEPRRAEVLEFSKSTEKVPVGREQPEEAQFEQPSREPGSDDGAPDPIEIECSEIVRLANAATNKVELDSLKSRALALPKDSPERKAAAAALTEAWGRICKGAA